jgi:hypothetical protein
MRVRNIYIYFARYAFCKPKVYPSDDSIEKIDEIKEAEYTTSSR